MQMGAAQTVSSVPVENGRFTIILNAGGEFGAQAFNGQRRWLEIAVRCPAGSGTYTTLQPRQMLSAAPYAHSLAPGALISGSVGAPTNAVLSLGNVYSNGVGLRVFDTGLDGVFVDRAGRNGVYVGSVAEDGLFVCSTGQLQGCAPSVTQNGVEIGNALDNGVRVVNAGQIGFVVDQAVLDGTFVGSAGRDGLHVGSAAVSGVSIQDAGINGVDVINSVVNGVRVYDASTGINVFGSDLAGYFIGSVEITGGCTGCALANFGLNMGASELHPGDVVILTGSRAGSTEAAPVLLEVAQANGSGGAVVGVVMGRAEAVQV